LGTRISDITPTILAWLGLPAALDMAGRAAPFLGREHDETVTSYDNIAIERPPSQQPQIESEIIDQLRGLGYVE
jgi:arylsulfatase A-like enzyme